MLVMKIVSTYHDCLTVAAIHRYRYGRSSERNLINQASAVSLNLNRLAPRKAYQYHCTGPGINNASEINIIYIFILLFSYWKQKRFITVIEIANTAKFPVPEKRNSGCFIALWKYLFTFLVFARLICIISLLLHDFFGICSL